MSALLMAAAIVTAAMLTPHSPTLTDGPPCVDQDGNVVAYWPCYYLPDGHGGMDVYTPDERNN